MSSAVEEYVIYQISNAQIQDYPYPHFYVENVFPADFYARLRANWPDSSALTSLAETGRVSKGAYPDRFVLPFTPSDIEKLSEDRRAFWSEFGSWFMAHRFLQTAINKFGRYAQQRFGNDLKHCRFEADSLLVRDRTNYSIGPHTDATHRLLSMLFYCPDNDSMKHLGTSIYVPLDPDFRCVGGKHYPHNRFQKVWTVDYKPNSLFSFFKTNNSFHGVDPIRDQEVQRDILLYDVRVGSPQHHKKPGTDTPSGPGRIGLKILGKLFGSSNT